MTDRSSEIGFGEETGRVESEPVDRPEESGILSRANAFSQNVDHLSTGVTNPFDIVIDDVLSAVEGIIDGRPTLLFGTNSYLGLNFHPACINAAVEATAHFGTGSTASRVAAGNHQLHTALEADIAAFYGCESAIIFSTGFMANLGIVAGLARNGDAVFVDAHSHASIFDACRLSGAKLFTFRHNDADDLERLFRESPVRGPRTLVVLEGLYSVWGDLGALKEIVAIANRHGAVVIVDEAHALGIYGEHGRGVSESLGIEDQVDVIVGTFSKSVGVIGGYAVTKRRELRSLRFTMRPYLYTASPPLPVVAAAREAIKVISTDRCLSDAVWRNAHTIHAGLTALGLEPSAAPGPVGSIRMPGLRSGYNFWKALLDQGVFVNLLAPPATPLGEITLRYSVSAAHTPEQITIALEAFREAAARNGVE